LVSEISAFASIGAGRWSSCTNLTVAGVVWQKDAWELAIDTHGKSWQVDSGETVVEQPNLVCASSTDLAVISNGAGHWSLDIREQALGAFQQYLRNQNMFAFWNQTADKMEPMFSNANFHPKQQVIENSAWGILGRGNWNSSVQACINGVEWMQQAWEVAIDKNEKSHRVFPDDQVP
jgi:hypothetical protein